MSQINITHDIKVLKEDDWWGRDYVYFSEEDAFGPKPDILANNANNLNAKIMQATDSGNL